MMPEFELEYSSEVATVGIAPLISMQTGRVGSRVV